jgi:hypothetical protein
VKTKMHRKDWCWFMRLVYDPRELVGVTTARLVVDGCYNYNDDRKDWCWSMRLVYDPRELVGVMTARLVVDGCYNYNDDILLL